MQRVLNTEEKANELKAEKVISEAVAAEIKGKLGMKVGKQ
jgi:hypothetical protein